MQAVIVAGGKGKRLARLTKNIPKPLIKIGKIPLIEHQIKLLEKHGIKEIFILSGYLGQKLRKYLGDGKKWGVNIIHYQEEKPLGTAGALKTLAGKINEDFLFLSGDIMLDLDIQKFIHWYRQKKAEGREKNKIASIVVHSTDHPFDSDLVEVGKNERINSFLIRPHPEGKTLPRLGIASVFIFSPDIFKHITSRKKTDIEKDVLPQLDLTKYNIYAYNTSEYLKDMGTPKRLEEVNYDYAQKKIEKLNLKNRRKAVFLDRDGVIVKEVDNLSRVGDLKIYAFSANAIKKINNSNYLTIITTNQPMIAKGFMTENDLDEIHKKLETELGQKGVKIDAIYHCPHHPEKGFAGEIPGLKIKCACRKPAIGLFKKAEKEFNVDLKESYVIGDKTSDILAGKRAGCKTILVKTGYGGKDGAFSVKPDFSAKNLAEAIEVILKES